MGVQSFIVRKQIGEMGSTASGPIQVVIRADTALEAKALGAIELGVPPERVQAFPFNTRGDVPGGAARYMEAVERSKRGEQIVDESDPL